MLFSYLFWHWPGGQWPNPLPDALSPNPDPGPGPGPDPGPGTVTFTLYNADPGDLGVVLSECSFGPDPPLPTPPVTAADCYDGNVDNGGHISGPFYPIVAQLLFENPITVNNVLISHAPEGWTPPGYLIASNPLNWMYRGEVWGLREDDVWLYLGTGITNGSGGMSGTAARFILYEFDPGVYKGLRIVDLENDHPGAGWFPSEFGFNATIP
jgi:hypothetical protein